MQQTKFHFLDTHLKHKQKYSEIKKENRLKPWNRQVKLIEDIFPKNLLNNKANNKIHEFKK